MLPHLRNFPLKGAVYCHNYVRSPACTHALRKQREPASSIGRKTERKTGRQKEDIWKKNLEGIELKAYNKWPSFFLLPLPNLLKTYMRKNLFGELEMGEENDADKPNHSLSIGCMQIMWPNYKGEESLWELARLLWLAVVCSLLKTGHQFKS